MGNSIVGIAFVIYTVVICAACFYWGYRTAIALMLGALTKAGIKKETISAALDGLKKK